jgi:hypothetical protein
MLAIVVFDTICCVIGHHGLDHAVEGNCIGGNIAQWIHISRFVVWVVMRHHDEALVCLLVLDKLEVEAVEAQSDDEFPVLRFGAGVVVGVAKEP